VADQQAQRHQGNISSPPIQRCNERQIYPYPVDYTGNAGASLAPTTGAVRVCDASRYRTDLSRRRDDEDPVRLTNVKTYIGATLVSDYRLASEPGRSSLISLITTCAGDRSCLRTRWAGPMAETGRLAIRLLHYPGAWAHRACGVGPVAGDFNGDGNPISASLGEPIVKRSYVEFKATVMGASPQVRRPVILTARF